MPASLATGSVRYIESLHPEALSCGKVDVHIRRAVLLPPRPDLKVISTLNAGVTENLRQSRFILSFKVFLIVF